MNTSTTRVRRSHEAWQQLIQEQTNSGMTQAAFCDANAVSLSSFQNWKRKLSTQEDAAPWVDLGILDQPQPSQTWEIELTLGDGISLRMRRC